MPFKLQHKYLKDWHQYLQGQHKDLTNRHHNQTYWYNIWPLPTQSFKPLEGHKASTTVLHLGRSLAAFLASAHVSWQAFSSDSMVRLHVVVGLPLLLLPCGFQSNAFLVMLLFWRLRIWPIHFHLRFLHRRSPCNSKKI